MRLWEVVLLLINVVVPVAALRPLPRVAWAGIAGVDLVVLLVHVGIEGARYQMVPAYIAAGLLVVYALFKSTGRAVRVPRVLRFAAIAGIGLCLALGALPAAALPVFTLPEPTGSAAVGVRYLYWLDEKRTDPFLAGTTQQRELAVKVYYPAEADGTKPTVPYMHNARGLVRAMTAAYQLPEFLFDHLLLVQTHARQGLVPSGQESSYPVVLFSHGAGTTMEVQTTQPENLASHGYVVVAIDHPYVSAATVFPDRIVLAREATTDFGTVEPAALITEIMAQDVQFVIEKLDALNRDRTDPLYGKLNLKELGVMGHSVGGAVAYNLANRDARIKAAIDLDGTVFVTPSTEGTGAPFLMLANDTFHVQMIRKHENLMPKFQEAAPEERKLLLAMYGTQEEYEAAYARAQENMEGLVRVLRASGNLYTIQGSDHMKFIDVGLFLGFAPLRELIGIHGDTDPARVLEITNAVTLAFLDRTLRGQADTLDTLSAVYPELQKVALP